MPEERLISSINDSVKERARIEKINKDFNELIDLKDRFSKPKIKEIRKDIYRIVNKKIKEAGKSLKLEKNLSKLKRYQNYDDIEYRGIRGVKNLFGLSIDEDYYKPIKIILNTKVKEIRAELSMVRPYLRDIINNHKTQGAWKFYSGNEVIDYKIQGELKIQLTMNINFISSKDSDEIRTMHTKSNNMEIMMGNETDEIIEELL